MNNNNNNIISKDIEKAKRLETYYNNSRNNHKDLINLIENYDHEGLDSDIYKLTNSMNKSKDEILIISPKAYNIICEIDNTIFEYSKRCKNIANKFLLETVSSRKRAISLALMDILLIIFGNLHSEQSIKSTAFKSRFAREFIIASLTWNYNNVKDRLKEEVDVNERAKYIKENSHISQIEELELGQLLCSAFEHHGFLEIKQTKSTKTSEYVRLTSKAIRTLEIMPVGGVVLPRLNSFEGYTSLSKQIFYRDNDITDTRRSTTEIDDYTIEALNISNRVEMKLNHKILELTMDNMLSAYETYSEGETLALDFDNVEEYIESRTIKEKDMSSFFRNYLENKWSRSEQDLLIFVNTLVFMNALKHKKFAFAYMLDWRGRVYAIGFPLNPQSSKFFRQFYTFKDTIPHNFLAGYDVNASGFQIASLITGDINVLYQTNFFINETSNEKQIDLYENLLNKIQNYDNKELYKIYEHYIDLSLRENKKDTTWDKEGDFVKVFNTRVVNKSKKEQPTPLTEEECTTLISLLNRKIIKSCAMRRLYSEGSMSRSNSLRLFFIDKTRKIDIDYRFTFALAILIDIIINETYPLLIELEKTLKKIALIKSARGEAITIYSGKGHLKTQAMYPAFESMRINVRNFKDSNSKDKRIMVQIPKSPIKIDTKKVQRSITPNFIHNLDSHVCMKMIHKCHENNISMFPVHDCFTVDRCNSETLKSLYFETCKEIFIDQNPLKIFLDENNISDEEVIEFSNKCYENIKEIFSKNLKMSSDILKE